MSFEESGARASARQRALSCIALAGDLRTEVAARSQCLDRGVIRVNHYMGYEGVRFYQSFFGPAAVMSRFVCYITQ